MPKHGRKVKYLGLVSLLAALVLVMVLGLAMPAQADKPTFSINITLVQGGGGETVPPYTSPICLEGNASATDFPGRLSQYNVQIDWGDGEIDDYSNVDFYPSDGDFSGTWNSSPCHPYLEAGTYNITVKLYHQRPPGAESGDVQTTVTIRVVNTPPEAMDDAYSVDEDSTLDVDAPGVLANDSDVDGDLLSAVKISDVSSGTLTLNANGSFTYQPIPDFYGIDSFTYQAYDGEAYSDNATVTITVNPVNNAPVAVDDADTTDEDTPVATNIVANDTDADGTIDPTTVAITAGPSDGAVVNNGDGNVTYTPNLNFVGSDSYNYTVQDDDGATSNEATVTITVNPVNDAPVAVDDEYSMDEDTTLNVDAPGVLTNDADVDGDPLTAVLDSDVGSGALTLNANGSFTYQPIPNFNGIDSFTYQAYDGEAYSDNATVTITVNPVNNAPVAVDDADTTDEDTPVATNVVANDTDADGTIDPTTVVITAGPSDGAVVNNGNGNVTYTPNLNFVGSDSYNYTVQDDDGATSNEATVTITVNPVNDAPVAADDYYSVNEDSTLNVGVPGVLTNDADVDGDPLTAVLVSDVSSGVLTLNANGSLSYEPNPNFNGIDSFTYQAYDGTFYSENATVTITVNPVLDGGGGGLGWVGPACSETLTVDFLGEITQASMKRNGCLCEDLDASSPDEMHLLEIEKDTKVLDSEGEVVKLIEITEATTPPLPASTAVVGNAYNFSPSGIKFDQPVTLTLGYNVGELPEDTLALSMRYYTSEEVWIQLKTESSQVAEIGMLTGTTDHFTVFAILADLPSFEVSNLSITPLRTEIWDTLSFVVRTGEEAVITVDVANTGNHEASCTVSVEVNGETRATQEVTLAPGQSEQVAFTISGNEPGHYEIVVADLSGEFTSSFWINWWLIADILIVLAVIGFLAAWWYRRRRKPVPVE